MSCASKVRKSSILALVTSQIWQSSDRGSCISLTKSKNVVKTNSVGLISSLFGEETDEVKKTLGAWDCPFKEVFFEFFWAYVFFMA